MPREIPLTRGYVAIVDDEDYELVAALSWQVGLGPCSPRPRRSWTEDGRRRWTTIANVILGLTPSKKFVVDHINGNALDNRRQNLRLCSQAENHRNRGKPRNNSTGYKGVWRDQGGRYAASIKYRDRTQHLGRFQTKEEAARAYDAAAIRLHGEFARLNFPAPGQEAA